MDWFSPVSILMLFLLLVILVLASIGSVVVGEYFTDMRQLKKAAEERPKPQPRLWRVNFCDPAGYPTRTFKLDERAMCKIMAMVCHEVDHPPQLPSA